MWIDIQGERLGEIRVANAVKKGAEMLVTSCPFCILTFEDAVKTLGFEERIQVLDVSELLVMAI